MGSEIQKIFDVELITLFQRVTPVVVLLILGYGFRKRDWVKWGFLLAAFGLSMYWANEYILPRASIKWHQVVVNYFRPETMIPTLEKHAADRYVMAQVGRDNFVRLFEYDALLSRRRTSEVDNGSFVLVYHFLPLARFQADDTIEVVAKGGLVESAYWIPNCLVDESRCNFEVTRDEALALGRINGVSGVDEKLGTTFFSDQGLVIEVSSCTSNRRVLIDYRDGAVVGTGEAVGCDGLGR